MTKDFSTMNHLFEGYFAYFLSIFKKVGYKIG